MRAFSWAGVGAVTAAALSGAVLASQEQRPPQFRAGVTLVPIEVRAVHKDGRPVTDLTAADFVIRDAGQREEVAQFRAVSAESDSDESGRTFFVVLDRGRPNQPTKAMKSLTIRLDARRAKALATVARESGRTMSAIIREAIDAALVPETIGAKARHVRGRLRLPVRRSGWRAFLRARSVRP